MRYDAQTSISSGIARRVWQEEGILMYDGTRHPWLASESHIMEDALVTISHAVRTPLAAAKGYATALLRHDDHLLGEERLAMVGEINLACDRLEKVIAQLLESARLMQGVIPLQLHPHDLLQLTNVAIAQREAARPIGATPAPTIIVSHDHDLDLFVSADGRLLTLALGHLLQNALNTSSTEQSITIAMQTTGNTVEWSVRDQGAGIAAEHLQHICEPFYRVATDATSDMGGLGLGLTLSQRVIALHGSVLQGESQLGLGSRFWFTLPLVTTVG